MRRRPVAQYTPLTSLLDVLFVLVFASLIYSAGLEAKQKEAAAARPAANRAAPSAIPPALVSIDPERLRKAAVAEILAGLESRQAVVARISADGRLRQLERRQDDAPVVTPVELPLVERVPDPDVNLIYLGDRSPDLRLCSLIRLQLASPDLSQTIVIVALDEPLEQLSVALARGLKRDVDRCTGDQRGVAVLLDPRATGEPTPGAPTTSDPPANDEEKTP
jgi:hypothetical protein